jgi:hypothetical protein
VLPLSEVDALIFADPAQTVEPVKVPQPRLIEAAAARPAPPPDSEGTEMAVRYGLHQLDADLGEPLEIRQGTNGEIQLDASEASPRLQALLKEKFSSLPNTKLELSKGASSDCESCPVPAGAGQENPSPPITVTPVVNINEMRLEQIFGDARAQESFTREVLSLSGDVLSHCFALRNLAIRYPASVESGLTPVARKELQEMVDDHFAMLGEGFSHLQGLLRPLLEALSGSGGMNAGIPRDTEMTGHVAESAGLLSPATRGSGPDSGDSWQAWSFPMLATMQKADLLMRSLLTSTNNPLPAEQIIPPLRQAMSVQQRALKRYTEQGMYQRDSADK